MKEFPDGDKIKLKNLVKKVVAKFLAVPGESRDKRELRELCRAKVKSSPKVRVDGDYIYLESQKK